MSGIVMSHNTNPTLRFGVNAPVPQQTPACKISCRDGEWYGANEPQIALTYSDCFKSGAS